MNGVEILKIIPTEEPSLLLYFLITFSIAGIGLFTAIKLDTQKSVLIWLVSLLISVGVGIFILQSPCFQKPTGEYTYEIQTTEECKINEFKRYYEILEEKDNNVYIVKDKTIEK